MLFYRGYSNQQPAIDSAVHKTKSSLSGQGPETLASADKLPASAEPAMDSSVSIESTSPARSATHGGNVVLQGHAQRDDLLPSLKKRLSTDSRFGHQ